MGAPAPSASPLQLHTASPAELQRRIEAERRGDPFLVYRDAQGDEHVYTLDESASRRLSVGRGLDADLALSWDTRVSTVHAELERIGGAWAIVDDGLSRNGTYVNGERISGRRRLRDGDVLQFGETVAAFRAPLQATTKTATWSGASVLSAAQLSDAQRRVLVALCRPFKHPGSYITPPTNQEIASELFLSVDAVKTHLRALFQRFEIEDVPQNQKRLLLVERAFHTGVVQHWDL